MKRDGTEEVEWDRVLWNDEGPSVVLVWGTTMQAGAASRLVAACARTQKTNEGTKQISKIIAIRTTKNREGDMNCAHDVTEEK